jgi:hypothetical protein
MRHWACVAVAFPCMVFARGADILYLGLTGPAASSVEGEFGRNLRELLPTAPNIGVYDEQRTGMCRKKLRSEGHSTVSEVLLRSLEPFCSDTTLVVWGRVEKLDFRPRRRLLVRGAVDAGLAIKLIGYSLLEKKYLFGGTLAVDTSISKGFIFFYPLDRAVRVEALERERITGYLARKSAHYAAGLIVDAVKKKHIKDEYIPVVDTGPPPPGIFDIEMMEGEAVQEEELDTLEAGVDSLTEEAGTPAGEVPEETADTAVQNQP